MTLELIDIAVRDRAPHPRLPGRVTGHVRAVLAECEQRHELSIPVWADVGGGSSDSDIDMALMLKAARIIARLKANLG
jgi:hypothetical protein